MPSFRRRDLRPLRDAAERWDAEDREIGPSQQRPDELIAFLTQLYGESQ